MSSNSIEQYQITYDSQDVTVALRNIAETLQISNYQIFTDNTDSTSHLRLNFSNSYPNEGAYLEIVPSANTFPLQFKMPPWYGSQLYVNNNITIYYPIYHPNAQSRINFNTDLVLNVVKSGSACFFGLANGVRGVADKVLNFFYGVPFIEEGAKKEYLTAGAISIEHVHKATASSAYTLHPSIYLVPQEPKIVSGIVGTAVTGFKKYCFHDKKNICEFFTFSCPLYYPLQGDYNLLVSKDGIFRNPYERNAESISIIEIKNEQYVKIREFYFKL